MLKLYIINSEEFNKGELIGGWIIFPYSESVLDNLFNDIKIKNNNYLIYDYRTELNLDIGKYDRINELNDFYKEYNELNEGDKRLINIICNDFDCDLIESTQNIGSLKDVIKQYENIVK